MWLLNEAVGELTIVLCVLTTLHQSFVELSPVNTSQFSGNDGVDKALPTSFDEVKQLEDLKRSLVNDGQQNVATIKDAVLNATDDIPPSIVHKVVDEQLNSNQRQAEMITKRNQRPATNMENKYSSYRVQYTPRDMAEYVFWTGDEKRVTLAIEEFLEAGQMTREEAISFLQDIKANLDYLETHYSQQDMFRRHDQFTENEPKDRMRMMQQQAFSKPGVNEDYKSTNIELDKKDMMDRPLPSTSPAMQDEPSSPVRSNQVQQQNNPNMSEEEYAELLERLKVADYLYTEYSLEEVIYQLAKVMFSQSITRGSNEAQEALQTFTNYLTTEADMGRISKGLQKKVLDVLIASLTDTLAEHPKAMSVAMLNLAPKDSSTVQSANMMLHQILMLNPRGPNGQQVALMPTHRLEKLNAETVLGEHQSLHGKEGGSNEVEKKKQINLPILDGKPIKSN